MIRPVLSDMGIFASLARVFSRRPVAPALAPPASRDVRGPMVLSRQGRLWELPDRDTAMMEAEQGRFQRVAELLDAMRGDGLIRGILGTRSAGMFSLPTIFDGDPWLVDVLRGRPAKYDEQTGARIEPRLPGMWERILPLSEATAVVEDGIMAGVGIGYMEDDPLPGGWRRLRRLDLHWLTYRHHEDGWYYQDARRGVVKVTPGDGRWALFTPYGRHRPWARGAWYPCAGPFISKAGASVDRMRWQKFLADGLRYIEQEEGASEVHLQAMVQFMRDGWSYAPGLVTPKGYKPGILESSGRGYEVYSQTESRADIEIMVGLAGQVTTTEGGKGFSSGDIWRDIALSLIQTTATAASEWIGGDIIDPWTQAIGQPRDAVRATWDVRDPAQRTAAADAATSAAGAIEAIDRVAEKRGQRVNATSFFRDHGVAVELEALSGAPTSRALPPAGTTPLLLGDGSPTQEPVPGEAAVLLAAKMTEHVVERCPHEAVNRCRLCGVERVRDFEVGADGTIRWIVAWQPIGGGPAAGDAAEGGTV